MCLVSKSSDTKIVSLKVTSEVADTTGASFRKRALNLNTSFQNNIGKSSCYLLRNSCGNLAPLLHLFRVINQKEAYTS